MSDSVSAFARAARENHGEPWAMEHRRPIYDRLLLLPMGFLVWTLLVLMIVPEGFDYRMLADGDAPMAGSRLSRLLWLSLLASGIAVVAWRIRLMWALTLSSVNVFLLLFTALAVASIAWSIEPALTARRAIRLVTILAVATAFVLVAWHETRFQNVLRPVLTLLLFGSLLFGFVSPQLGIHHEADGMIAGDWKGLASHKNALGNLACIGLIFWCHAGLTRQVRLPAVALGAAISILCLYLSGSTTSLLTAVFVLVFMVLLMRAPAAIRGYLPWVVALFTLALMVYSLALLQIIPGLSKLLGPISAITGKDMTFTGRTDIWRIVTEHIGQHPLLGSGYGAYWAGVVPGAPSYAFIRELNFYPGSAHNGYLDIVNDLGAVGLIVLVAYLLVYLRQALQLLPRDRAQASLYLALFLQQGITNLSESRWLNAQSVDFLIMTLATMALARSLLVVRQRGVRHRQAHRTFVVEPAVARLNDARGN